MLQYISSNSIKNALTIYLYINSVLYYKSFMVKFDIFLADLGVNHRRI